MRLPRSWIGIVHPGGQVLLITEGAGDYEERRRYAETVGLKPVALANSPTPILFRSARMTVYKPFSMNFRVARCAHLSKNSVAT
jgi:hypothetical protein